jgi:hypothetical protein
MAWPRAASAEAKPRGNEVFPKAVETRALVFYRAILGGQGATRKRKDGTGDPAGTFAKGEGAIDDA